MRTKAARKRKVNIVTLGCSKNIVDSELLYSQLRANNVEVEHESAKDDADIVVINTCGFIDNAKQESVDTILRYIDAKKEGLVEQVFVTGCLSQRYKPDLEKEIPEVDQYFGTQHLPQLLKALGADYKHELIGERSVTTPAHYAYLKISEGCDRPCSFCAIPIMRGGHVSKPMDQLVAEAQHLARNGTRELLLIAQDSTYYGLDLYKERRLADLLRALSDVNGIDWIRLHYAYPSQFPLDVLDVMRERDNICNYIDMPLQHISDNMLKVMRRGITSRRTRELVETVREKVPGIAFRTTLIAGHPGETRADFEELLQFVEETRFDRLGVFAYSHEEGTHSHSMADDILQEEKDERVARIMEVQEGISLELNKKRVGQTLKALFDRKEGDYFIGRSEADSPEVDNEVLVPATGYVRVGDFANVRITSATEFDLYGEPVE